MGKGPIISFAWTTPAIRDRSKTVTRRFWSDAYAKRFRPGMICQAYDKSPRFKGRKICDIEITAVYRQPLILMTQEHFAREGGTRFWKDLNEFIDMMGGLDECPWVVEFKYV